MMSASRNVRSLSAFIYLICIASLSLLSAAFGLRFIHEPQSVVISPGTGVALQCSVDPSDADVRWIFNGTELGVSGPTLRLLPSRGQFDGVYQCLANSSTGAILSAEARVSYAYMVSSSSETSNYSVHVIDGNTAVIPCSPPSALPTPLIDFERNGTLLNKYPRYRVLPSGSLQINHARRPADEGFYRCIAFNPVTRHRAPSLHTVQLVITAPSVRREPEFTRRPAPNVEVVQGQNVTLECAAEGWPIPRVWWSKDGGTLPADRHHMIFGNLVLHNVTSTDKGTYVCHAESSENHVENTSTVLEVLEPPVIIDDVGTREAVEGSTVRLSCNVRSSISPSVKWFRNGAEATTSQNVHMSADRGLVLRNVRLDDAGMYQCFASNRLGSVYSTVRLIIEEMSFMTQDPSTDASSATRLQHSDFQYVATDGVRSSPRLRSRTRTSSVPPSSSVVATVKVDALSVPVTSTPDLFPPDQFLSTVSDVIRSTESAVRSTRPVPPSRPKITRKTGSSVLVEWSTSSENNSMPIMFFKIQFQETVDGSKPKNSWHTVDGEIPASKREFEVSGLKPGSYKFRVVAVYSNGDNQHGPNSNRFVLEHSTSRGRVRVPNTIPSIVEARGTSNTSISLTWQYNPSERTLIDGFVIEYHPYNGGDKNYTTVLDQKARSIVLNNLEPGTMYSIRMQAFNGAGYSEFSNSVARETLGGADDEMSFVYASDSSGSTTFPEVAYIPNRLSTRSSNELLYVVLGVVLGSTLLTLVVVMFVCAWKQRKHQQMIGNNGSEGEIQNFVFIDCRVTAARRGESKFHDPARAIYLNSISRNSQLQKGGGGFLLSTIDSSAGNRLANGNSQHRGSGKWLGNVVNQPPSDVRGEPAIKPEPHPEMGPRGNPDSRENMRMLEAGGGEGIDEHHDPNIQLTDVADDQIASILPDPGVIQRPRDIVASTSQQHLQRSLRGCSENGSRQSSSLNRDRRTSPDHIPRIHECWSLEPVRRATRERAYRVGEPSSEMSSLDSFPMSSRQMLCSAREPLPEHLAVSGVSRGRDDHSTDVEPNTSGTESTKPLIRSSYSSPCNLPPPTRDTMSSLPVVPDEVDPVSCSLLAECDTLPLDGPYQQPYGNGHSADEGRSGLLHASDMHSFSRDVR